MSVYKRPCPILIRSCPCRCTECDVLLRASPSRSAARVLTPAGMKRAFLHNRKCRQCGRLFCYEGVIEKVSLIRFLVPPNMRLYRRTCTFMNVYLPQDPVTDRKTKKCYGAETYAQNDIIYVQQNLYATKSFCQDLTRKFQLCKTGANNLAELFNHTVAFDAPESLGDDRFLANGNPLHSAFQMYDLQDAIIPRVRPSTLTL